MKRIRTTIEGISPLLMNRYTGEKSPDITQFTPEQHEAHALERAYFENNIEGKGFYIPGEAIEQCLINGGEHLQHSHPSLPHLGSAGLEVVDEKVFLHRTNRGGNVSYEIDTRVCRTPNSGRPTLTSRVKVIPVWIATFTTKFDDSVIDYDKYVEATRVAGLWVGLLDRRPAKGGTFGRFKITSMEIVE